MFVDLEENRQHETDINRLYLDWLWLEKKVQISS